jgi:hypothetical protein
MTTPSRQKRARSFVGGLIPSSTQKTSATVQAGTKKRPFYKPLPKAFQRDGFSHRQTARKGDAAIYEQSWNGSTGPSIAYEVVRIRRREGFEIAGRLVTPAEVYPNSKAWGVDGFTLADKDAAFAKLEQMRFENEQ